MNYRKRELVSKRLVLSEVSQHVTVAITSRTSPKERGLLRARRGRGRFTFSCLCPPAFSLALSYGDPLCVYTPYLCKRPSTSRESCAPLTQPPTLSGAVETRGDASWAFWESSLFAPERNPSKRWPFPVHHAAAGWPLKPCGHREATPGSPLPLRTVDEKGRQQKSPMRSSVPTADVGPEFNLPSA